MSQPNQNLVIRIKPYQYIHVLDQNTYVAPAFPNLFIQNNFTTLKPHAGQRGKPSS